MIIQLVLVLIIIIISVYKLIVDNVKVNVMDVLDHLLSVMHVQTLKKQLLPNVFYVKEIKHLTVLIIVFVIL